MLLLVAKLKIHLFLAYLIAINITTFLLYSYDKLVSLFSLLRVPESVLHFLTLLGGTPMAYFAQKFISHKKSKAVFQSTFRKIVFLQLLIAFIIGAAILYMA